MLSQQSLKSRDGVVNANSRIVALDLGTKRVGVASANVVARLASPLTTLTVSDHLVDDIRQLLAQETALALVVGLPRGLNGQDTDQTRWARQLGESLQKQLSLPLYWQDEALSSHRSEQELAAKSPGYSKAAVDALAATYILEDFLTNLPPELAHV